MASPDIIIAALRRRPKILIVAFTLSVLAAVAALQANDLRLQYQQTLIAAETRAANQSLVVAEYVRGSFTVADTALRQLAVHGTRMGGVEAPPDEWRAVLASATAAMPGGGSISVADAKGIIRHSTLPALIGNDRSDQYIYRHLSTTGGADFVVDTPLFSERLNRYVIPIGRRLKRANGRFDGVVVTTVMPEAYRTFIGTLDVGKHGIISVVHPEGVVVFREPSSDNPIGQSATKNPVWQAARASNGSGVVKGPLEAGGPSFASGYFTLGTPPLIVTVSLNEDDVLEDWRHQRQTSTIAFVVLTVTLGGVVLVLFRQMNQTARVERELVEVQRNEAVRLRDANEQLEDALAREQQARREVETASYLKDEFLMMVSHELRTPLTAIYGWVRMLSTGSMAPEERGRALAAVERNARAQTRLIEDLLDVSRAISGKLRIDARGVNLNDVVRAAVETVRPAMQAKNIHFESSLAEQPAQILADPDRVQQIVWNLLSNAIKFTPDGGTVRLAVARQDSTLEIVVSDTGAGIAPDFLPYVFDRFRQGEAGTRRRYGGLGLGLAIVRHLTELHGGSVSAESEGEGKGATFRVRLPLRVPTPAPPVEPAVPVATAPRRRDQRLDGVRVLVVDDESDARELFASMLDAAGAVVLTAASAHDAMRLLESEKQVVLLSDIEMPGEDGYQLLARARAKSDARGTRLVAIAVTAYARTIDRERAIDAGFDAYLAKPIDPADLVAAIASLSTGVAG